MPQGHSVLGTLQRAAPGAALEELAHQCYWNSGVEDSGGWAGGDLPVAPSLHLHHWPQGPCQILDSSRLHLSLLVKTGLLVLKMQREFIDVGGFGWLLGNDTSMLREIVPNVQALMESAREANLTIIHVKESHRDDLSDVPLSKLKRALKQSAGRTRSIGDHVSRKAVAQVFPLVIILHCTSAQF
ncbi:hypothetical protein CBR_g58795 [Chara braunii]|uniref:Uncharacterized protein n=1 Tax=Chara braunii TaxID=69332 RepID=A0A388K8A7_CHABU|nr:hypothetical protein CBR_g58795 [Chara braunii]|eukprot:GBG66304.1 hypothetical protein CBR_g58795 [Chara braunii]